MGLFRKDKEETKFDAEKITSKERLNKDWLRCVFIIEIMGRPPKYISDAMKLVLKGFSKEKGVEVLKHKIHKPKKVFLKGEKPDKKQKMRELFSTFSEIEFLVESMGRLTELTFDFMPSSVEILEPQTLKLEMNAARNIINDIATKLHKNDAVVKTLYAQNLNLKRELEELKK